MQKNFDHQQYEEAVARLWEENNLFTVPSGKEVRQQNKKTFSIIMPPPNANDPLHLGHAMFVAIEDILIRYHRMLGEVSLWLPGTDHAGIETQYVFEKKLAKEGKSRFDFDRETIYKMIWDYVHVNSDVAKNQIKRLGASADWSRFKFTLDSEVVDKVLDTFIQLHNDGLVYRSQKLVNYCTKCGTAYSELEVDHEERDDKLYNIAYGPVTVSTTRPETMFGDVAVAVNPDDSRYKDWIGKTVPLPLTEREIPVVADEMVDMEFGTGAVKITPAHDQNDWEVAVRQGWNLDELSEKYQVIGLNGKLTSQAGEYKGLSVLEARQKILSDLGDKLVQTKDYRHAVGTCYKCHRVIEPLPMKQFFIKVKPLVEKALLSLRNKETVVVGSGHDKILIHWLKNLKDWNISRQIVWGIRIPVWYKKGTTDEFVVAKKSPGEDYRQETDTFDTWFSSGQWPVVTLKTSKEEDFEAFYPTTVMETAYDILPFWVMRMMMMGIYMTGKSPFKYVYLHGLVRDEQGRKMSKSVGNVINPLDLVEKYGTDSLRMALVMSTTAGQDSSTGENKIRGMRNFGNKIWNAGRYLAEQTVSETRGESDDEFEKKLKEVVKEVSTHLSSLRIGLAAETVYGEFWHWFCDMAIEDSKKGKISTNALMSGYVTFLKLLHPFMPFVTEAIWREIVSKDEFLAVAKWPDGKE